MRHELFLMVPFANFETSIHASMLFLAFGMNVQACYQVFLVSYINTSIPNKKNLPWILPCIAHVKCGTVVISTSQWSTSSYSVESDLILAVRTSSSTSCQKCFSFMTFHKFSLFKLTLRINWMFWNNPESPPICCSNLDFSSALSCYNLGFSFCAFKSVSVSLFFGPQHLITIPIAIQGNFLPHYYTEDVHRSYRPQNSSVMPNRPYKRVIHIFSNLNAVCMSYQIYHVRRTMN